MLIFIKYIYINKGSMAVILDFTMAANLGYKVGNVSSAFVDLKNICLDTKIIFLLYLEAEM